MTIRGVNKVILIGNLGSEPEIHSTQQGGVIANVSIATDESYKDKNSGQMVPKTEWHRVVMFNRLADITQQYLHKGSKVFIEGRLQTRKWKGKDGQDRYTTEIVANEMQMLDGKITRKESNIDGSYEDQRKPDFYTNKPISVPSDFDDVPF